MQRIRLTPFIFLKEMKLGSPNTELAECLVECTDENCNGTSAEALEDFIGIYYEYTKIDRYPGEMQFILGEYKPPK